MEEGAWGTCWTSGLVSVDERVLMLDKKPHDCISLRPRSGCPLMSHQRDSQQRRHGLLGNGPILEDLRVEDEERLEAEDHILSQLGVWSTKTRWLVFSVGTTRAGSGVKAELQLHQEKTAEDPEGLVGLKGRRGAQERGFFPRRFLTQFRLLFLHKVCAEKPSLRGSPSPGPGTHTQWCFQITVRLPPISGLGSCSGFSKTSDTVRCPKWLRPSHRLPCPPNAWLTVSDLSRGPSQGG